MSFSTYEKSGEITSSQYPLFVHIYPNTPDEEGTDLDQACQGAADAGQQLKNYGAIDYYCIYEYEQDNSDYGYPYGDEYSRGGCYSEFKTWLNGKYDDRRGVHVVIENEFSGGAGKGTSGTDDTAFTISKPCAAGFPSKDEGQATVVHEMGHQMIDGSVVIGSDSSDLAPDDLHQLGTAYQGDSGGIVSPMANNGRDNPQAYGTCSNDLQEKGETTNMTYCTKEGTHRTAREAK